MNRIGNQALTDRAAWRTERETEENGTIARLIAKAEGDDWAPESHIDWDLKIRYPVWFRKRTYRSLVSQFHHGERAVLSMCETLGPRMPDPEARRFLALQGADEAKHARVYGTYAERLGGIAPMEETLARALDESLNWPGSAAGPILAFHIVFEGGVVALIEKLAWRLPRPLFRAINARILIDEARHIAFGAHYLRQRLPGMPVDERIALYRWVRDLWRQTGTETRQRYTLPVAMVTRLGAGWLQTGWRRQARILVGIGLISEAERARLDREQA